MTIVDIHCHTSERPMRNLHVTSATLADLEGYAKQYSISLIVLLATYFPRNGKMSGVHNYEMLRRIRDKPLFTMFGSLDVMNNLEDGVAELETMAEENLISGIKLYLGYQGFSAGDRRVYPVYEIAKKHRLPIMFHGGRTSHGTKAHQEKGGELARPIYMEKPATDFPSVKFVMSHFGYPYCDELHGVIARHPNVWTDISALVHSGFPKGSPKEDTEEHWQKMVGEIQKFLAIPKGTERVCFGTDFPIQSYEHSFELVRRAGIIGSNLEKVMGQNALHVLDRNFIP